MMRAWMKIAAPVLFVMCLTPVAAFSGSICLDCHGQRGATGFVDKTAFQQSVHGHLECTKCHLGMSDYPHGTVAKVKCIICHLTANEGAPKEQAQAYELSVHGRVTAVGKNKAPTCQTCHGSHAMLPSADPRSLTNRRRIPELCSQCHPAEFAAYQKSIHATALGLDLGLKAPTCFDCHLEHLVPPTGNDQWKLSLIKQCGFCHQEQIKTYRKTYHGKVTQLGYATMAKCSDCHGSHEILAVSDPASPLSGQNRIATCKKCHSGATAKFTEFYAHAEESNRAKYPVLYYTFIFMTLLLLGTFAFFFTHTFLWAYRSLRERIDRKGGD